MKPNQELWRWVWKKRWQNGRVRWNVDVCVEKKDKQWVWLAIDRDTWEVIRVHSGDRSRDGVQALWEFILDFYCQNARFYTAFWEAQGVFPADRHQSIGKEMGKTNHIERLNCTLKQRVSQLVRKTLSFSKKPESHIGAIWYFIHHYNSNIRNQLNYS